MVKDLQGYALKNLIKEMASDENKMGEEVKEKKDARPCGRLAKVILTGFLFLPGKVLNLPLSGGEAGDANKGRPAVGHHLYEEGEGQHNDHLIVSVLMVTMVMMTSPPCDTAAT